MRGRRAWKKIGDQIKGPIYNEEYRKKNSKRYEKGQLYGRFSGL